jgi:hypothetical protein
LGHAAWQLFASDYYAPACFTCYCWWLQQQLLGGASGQLQAAAALLVELARVASAANLAAQGNPVALTANTAAVLRGSAAGQ